MERKTSTWRTWRNVLWGRNENQRQTRRPFLPIPTLIFPIFGSRPNSSAVTQVVQNAENQSRTQISVGSGCRGDLGTRIRMAKGDGEGGGLPRSTFGVTSDRRLSYVTIRPYLSPQRQKPRILRHLDFSAVPLSEIVRIVRGHGP